MGQWAAVYVTMNRRGFIVMNRTTHQRMGEPAAVLLLFDAANNRIGMKPTVLAIKNAYPVAKHGRHGGRVVRAFRLMQEFGIDIAETIQFQNAEIDHDGVLVLNLRTARIASRGWERRKNAVD